MSDRDELVARLRNPIGAGIAPTLWFNRAADQIEHDGREIERLHQETTELIGYNEALTFKLVDAEVERDRFEAALGRACLVGGTTYLLDRALAAEAENRRLREALEKIASYQAGTVDAGMSPWTAQAALQRMIAATWDNAIEAAARG